MKLKLPQEVQEIIAKLNDGGHEAYAVGGCVRDSVLGRNPADWDITTAASPWQVKALFPRTVDTGLEHGTVTVLIGKKGFEVTTYRVDGKYEDGRHPKEVTFTRSLGEDLKRRDFTINAMAYHPSVGLVDLFGGMRDLQLRRICCVGEAGRRFDEDALRIMRAVRFAAQLGFSIEEQTRAAIVRQAPNLIKISAERVRTELVKLLVSDCPDMLREAYATGITAVVLPEFDRMMETPQNNPNHCWSVGEHTLRVLRGVPPQQGIRLAALLHDVGKPIKRTTDEKGVDHFYDHAGEGSRIARRILRRLKFDNKTITQVEQLVFWHDSVPGAHEKLVRRATSRMGKELFPQFLTLRRADVMAQSGWNRQEKLRQLEAVSHIFEEIRQAGQCLSLKELKLTGRDLLELGMKPGPEIGVLLQEALQVVIDEPEKNDREWLLTFAAGKLSYR